ncbi:MAG: hypothetical protein IJI83_03250 [Oscillospiraceae bacterium]|nr:hypothetical protein [Oscillospiraceae bacterium]
MINEKNAVEIDPEDIVSLVAFESPFDKRYLTAIGYVYLLRCLAYHVDDRLGKVYDERSKFLLSRDPEEVTDEVAERIGQKIVDTSREVIGSRTNDHVTVDIIRLIFESNPFDGEYDICPKTCEDLLALMENFDYDDVNFGIDAINGETAGLYPEDLKAMLEDCCSGKCPLKIYVDPELYGMRREDMFRTSSPNVC